MAKDMKFYEMLVHERNSNESDERRMKSADSTSQTAKVIVGTHVKEMTVCVIETQNSEHDFHF